MLDFTTGEVSIPEISLYSLFERNAGVNGSHPAIIFYEKYITYSKILKYIDSMAYELRHKCGIKNGDIVIISMDWSPQYIISLFSLLKIGARAFIINDNIKQSTMKSYIEKYGIKVIITCKNSFKYIHSDDITYIVADPADFLTLGKAIIENVKNRVKINYGEKIIKFYNFIYSENNEPEEADINSPKILFLIGPQIIGFTEKNMVTATFILNYWLPKLDKRPLFFSTMSQFSPAGLLYSVFIPVSFSGTIIISRNVSIFKNTRPDFVTGLCGSDFIKKNLQLKNFPVYCIMPEYRKSDIKKIENKNCHLIAGFSTDITLTSHLNPMDDIRESSIGLPLNYVQYKIVDGSMYIKSPQAASYVLEDNFEKMEEWHNTNIKVNIKDGYFYEV